MGSRVQRANRGNNNPAPLTFQERAAQNLRREVRRCEWLLRQLTGAEAQRLRGDLARAERALLNRDHAETTCMVAVLDGYGREDII